MTVVRLFTFETAREADDLGPRCGSSTSRRGGVRVPAIDATDVHFPDVPAESMTSTGAITVTCSMTATTL
jgi:hypothetical protein